MHNTDFISEKWRTVRRTRTLAHAHIISSVVPYLYVALYAEAQRQNKDSKELGGDSGTDVHRDPVFANTDGEVQVQACGGMFASVIGSTRSMGCE